MKLLLRVLPIISISVLLCQCETVTETASRSSSKSPAKSRYANKPVRTVKTTAYTHSEADHRRYRRKTALGTNLRYSRSFRSAAADWSLYPVGTRFQIVGSPVIYEIDDYGSALVGKDVIDLYKPTRAHMRAWGARHVKIRIIRWGSYRKSLEVMKPRTRHSHVREMVRRIQGRLS